ncbi:hypothetical protein [Pedobacter sp. SYSU D00535]|uniref:hypothetical protein n=1 Tax=Pedobacter sp. SYSU D00535 TaxID=2810308 RepID=UPI001A95A7A6|nr:hypothetical protein [Pedobacter sp. SYSU D00535]
MKTFTISILTEDDRAGDKSNKSLTKLPLEKPSDIPVYQDNASGEIIIPSDADLSFESLKLIIEKIR